MSRQVRKLPLDVSAMSRYVSAMKDGKDVLAAIDQAAALRSRTPLSGWMRANYDAFKARMEDRVPDWRELAEVFANAGLTDRSGNRPKPEAARKMWQRIRKEVEARPPRPKPETSAQQGTQHAGHQSASTNKHDPVIKQGDELARRLFGTKAD